MTSRWRRPLLVVAGVAAVVLGPALPAAAHATLASSSPAAQALLAQAPTSVNLRFSEDVGLGLGGVQVRDPGGTRVDVGQAVHPAGSGRLVQVGVRGGALGTYLVTYRVVSADSHPISGGYTFDVGHASPAPAVSGVGPGGNRTSGILLGVSRFVGYAGIITLVGALVFLGILWPGGGRGRTVRRLLSGGWVTALGGAVGGLLLQGPYAAGLSPVHALDPALLHPVTATTYGRALLLRIGFLLLLPALVLPLREGVVRRADRLTIGLVMLPLLATFSLTGHPAAGTNVPLALSVDVVHLLAVATWIGGLLVLAVGLLPTADAPVLTRVLPRWSRLATGAVVTLTATGTYAAWRELGLSVDRLTGTTYGRLLLVKVTLVLVVLAIGAVSRAWVRRHYLVPVVAAGWDEAAERPAPTPSDVRRLRRGVVAETAIAAVVIAVTALLVATSPGRVSSASAVGPVTESGQVAGRTVEIYLSPARTGRNELRVHLYDGAGRHAEVPQVTARLTSPDPGVGRYDLALRRVGPGEYENRSVALPVTGRWQLDVLVRTSEFDQGTVTRIITVR